MRELIDLAEEMLFFDEFTDFTLWLQTNKPEYRPIQKITEKDFRKLLQSYRKDRENDSY